MKTCDRDVLIGAGVILLCAALLAFAYGRNSRAAIPGYDVAAHFSKADGIGIGSEVRLSGVTVGKVVAQRLDDRFRAVLTMRLAPNVALPTDSAALIQSDGLLGAKFISLQPGADETNLKSGDEITFSQDSMSLDSLLEMIIAQGEAKRADKANSGGAAKAPR